jgi:hypothetical protein
MANLLDMWNAEHQLGSLIGRTGLRPVLALKGTATPPAQTTQPVAVRGDIPVAGRKVAETSARNGGKNISASSLGVELTSRRHGGRRYSDSYRNYRYTFVP